MQLQLRLLQRPNGRVRRRSKLHGKLPGATLGCSAQPPELQRTAEAQAVVAVPKADGAVLEEDLPQVECPLIAARLADGHRGFRITGFVYSPLDSPGKTADGKAADTGEIR
jgi:hypothetical protein